MRSYVCTGAEAKPQGSSRWQHAIRHPLCDARWLLLVALLLALAPLPVRAQIPSVSGDSNAFVEALVDRTDPWQGQQITYTFRYYEAIDALRLPGILVGQPDYEAPDYSNFWQEGDIEQINYQQAIGDRTYNVSELHTVLFPTASGLVTIPPARLILRDLPGVERVLETLPVTLNVKPLPAGAPDGFTGAVGDYRLTAQVDRTITKVDEPITLRLTLSGQGNVRLAPLPVLPDLAGWRILERGEDVRMEKAGGQIMGTRTLDYLLLPTVGGGIALPSIEYLFFDPLAGEYRGALTEPIGLTAEGAPAALAAPAAPIAAGAPVTPTIDPATNPAIALAAPAPAARTLPSIQPMAVPATIPAARPPLVGSAWYWALWLAPLAALVVGLGAHARSRRSAQRSVRRTQARAGHEALRAVSARSAAPESPAEQVGRAQRALLEYLGRKLGRPVSGLTRTDLAALLRARGAPAAAIATVQECLALGDRARFSPSVVEPGMAAQMQDRVGAAIRALEKVL